MNLDFVEEMPSQTLARALVLLEHFNSKHPEWGVRELSRELGISPASVHRMVKTFQTLGYLKQDDDTQRYSLGPKVMKLAGVYTHQNPLPSIASKVFENYADRFEYNFYLGKLYRFEVVYLAVLDGRGPIKIAVEPGGTTALHSTALGKVLLAFQSDDYIHEFIRRSDLHRYSPRSITDPEMLREQLNKIRKQGYAVNDGEHYAQVGAISVPVYDHTGRVTLATSLAYPIHLINDGRIQPENLVPLAQEITDEISYRSGQGRQR